MATGRLSGFQDGKEVLTAIAAFSSPGLDVVAEWSPQPPAVEPPTGRFATAPEGAPTLFRQMRLEPRIGDPPFSGKPVETPVAGGWIELADPPDQIDAAVIALYTDIWWPPSLSPLTTPAGAPTIDLTIHFRADLPVPTEPVLGVFTTRAALGGLIEEDGELYLPDGSLLAHSRQLALLNPMQASPLA
jgi:acyl-CoA thioesterase